MSRLYAAAEALQNIKIGERGGKAKLAGLLEVDQQQITNWEKRGISFEGAVKAEEALGCAAVWLKYGKGKMSPWPFTRELLVSVEQLGAANLRSLENKIRFAIGIPELPQLAEETKAPAGLPATSSSARQKAVRAKRPRSIGFRTGTE